MGVKYRVAEMALSFRRVGGGHLELAAEGAREIKQGEPHRVPDVVKQKADGLANIAFHGRKVPEYIWFKLLRREGFGGVADGAGGAPPPGKLGIPPRFLAAPAASLSFPT